MDAAASRADIVRQCFEAYRTNQRGILEGLFTDDFTFTSPYDDRINKATYFARCWPASIDHIASNDLERIVTQGDEAFVLYRCVTKDGHEFRNTELFAFAGDKIREINVYFGATYKNGTFVRQAG